MDKKLFDSMREQMEPGPEVRAALTEKLAQPVKKRPVPWMKYGAIAACAALVIGGFSVYSLRQNPELWILLTHDFHRDYFDATHLHSYVTVDGLTGTVTESAAVTTDTGTGGTETDPSTGDLPNRYDAPSGALPGGAYVGDAPVQEEAANAYQNLMDRFNGAYPDWYGGAYIDDTATLVVCLVESEDPGDKTLELQVLDWAGGPASRVAFTDVKYSLNYLKGLMDQLNALPEADPACREFMASWGIDEKANRIELTLTDVVDHILAILAELDPEDDAIYVQVGQRAVLTQGEDPVRHDVTTPGGVAVPDDEDLTAVEPWGDDLSGAHYDVQNLPAQLPQSKQPAVTQSAPEKNTPARTEDASTAGYFPG